MSRTVAALAAAFVGVVGAAGVVALTAAGDDGSAAAPSITDEAVLRDEIEAAIAEVRDATTTTAAEPPTATIDRSVRRGRSAVAEVVPTSPSTTVAPEPPAFLVADPATCPPAGHAAVIDRVNQMTWLCADGSVTAEMPMTSARSQPDPGVYEVYAKDLNASSTLTGQYSEMTHFVAFTYGEFQGARIAFHSVPTYRDGSYVQPLESVGSPERHGDSSGCIRVLPDDAVTIWDWLAIGDPVIVVS